MPTKLRPTMSLVPHAVAAVVPLSLGLIVGWYSRRGVMATHDRTSTPGTRRCCANRRTLPPPSCSASYGPSCTSCYTVGAAVFGATAGSDLGSCAAVYTALALNLLFNLSFPLLMFRARVLQNAMLATWATFLTAVLLLFLVTLVVAKSTRRPLSTWTPWITTWKRITPLLLLPYVFWLAFASILATSVFALNKNRIASS